ncbi:L,D-transpeptidase family protein [Nitrosomonas sp. ANs5]|uniref:L,D-transpeptidase family protein n=1 Tax=Nitrosomonas sp. ANs5 TaxID=3423941 RepID=UPI003D355D5B
MHLIAVIFSLTFVLLFAPDCKAESETWIIVDTTQLHLKVMQNDNVRLLLDNISIGRYGASKQRMKGSNQTPIGTFRIGWVKPDSRFYRFFGFNYPNREAADLALAENRISPKIWQTIIDAIERNDIPPQDTPLGGFLGIHGIGRGDRHIHAIYNWTNGCIALTNDQIDQLSPWLKTGMRVEIH